MTKQILIDRAVVEQWVQLLEKGDVLSEVKILGELRAALAQTEQPEHCGNKSCVPGYCYCEQPAQGEREKFESAYRKLYPVTCDIRPNKFELDGEGDYAETIVNVAWNLWQASHGITKGQQ